MEFIPINYGYFIKSEMKNILKSLKERHNFKSGARDLIKYIGPGLLVTVGFIDPGNWATNLAAGSDLFSSF